MEFVIQVERSNYAVFYVVLLKEKFRDAWRYLRSFYTYDRAANFIAEVKTQSAKGDYTWLTLKS